MDRREALRKLGVAGAVAAGGSAVLSSTVVAAAMSGVCIPVIPDPVDFIITQPVNAEQVIIQYGPGTMLGVDTIFQWSNAKIVTAANPVGGVRILGSTASRQVTLERRTTATGVGSARNWLPGGVYSVLLTVEWSCTGPTRSDTATYLVTATYNGNPLPNTATISVPKSA